MSEKRFELDVRLDMPKLLIDNATNKRYHLLLVNDIEEIVDLLNKQQSEIKEQNKQIEEGEFSFRTELAHHRVAEKELQEKIIDLKDDKNQLHKVISKLRQEVAELKTRNAVLSSKLNQIPKSIKEEWFDE